MGQDTITSTGPAARLDARTQPEQRPQTLGAMVLAAADRDGSALRYKDNGVWEEISYRELVGRQRHRQRDDRPWDQAGRPHLDPGRHAA